MNRDLEEFAAILEQSPDYRVLRRLGPQTEFAASDGGKEFTGLIIDVETTGLHPSAEVIELGMVKFAYSAKGQALRVLDRFSALQQPSQPIPPEIARLTKITDQMVSGHAIDAKAVEAFAAETCLAIAHNASFDRKIAEKFWPFFADMSWACSCEEIPWRENGLESRRLGHLLAERGFFHVGHRASDDCEALLFLLSLPLGEAQNSSLAALLANARKAKTRIWAVDAPYAAKERLKARGYRWSYGGDSPKAWWIDVEEAAAPSELDYLRGEVFHCAELRLPMARITARERYSVRPITTIISHPGAPRRA